MIDWWGWLLLWSGLVLVLVVVLATLAWWLFRKFLRLLGDVADLAERGAILDAADAELVRPQLAVLAAVSDARARENARRCARRERRRVRRERRLDRARRITGPEAAAGPWPADWYDKA